MKIVVEVEIVKCTNCNGSGKVEKCEFTPPFEKFIGDCDKCNGQGFVQKK